MRSPLHDRIDRFIAGEYTDRAMAAGRFWIGHGLAVVAEGPYQVSLVDDETDEPILTRYAGGALMRYPDIQSDAGIAVMNYVEQAYGCNC